MARKFLGFLCAILLGMFALVLYVGFNIHNGAGALRDLGWFYVVLGGLGVGQAVWKWSVSQTADSVDHLMQASALFLSASVAALGVIVLLKVPYQRGTTLILALVAACLFLRTLAARAAKRNQSS